MQHAQLNAASRGRSAKVKDKSLHAGGPSNSGFENQCPETSYMPGKKRVSSTYSKILLKVVNLCVPVHCRDLHPYHLPQGRS